jgi:hypothetical protein
VGGMAGEVYALDHNAVWKWLEKHKIKNEVHVFDKVNWLFYQLLEIQRLSKGNSDAG